MAAVLASAWDAVRVPPLAAPRLGACPSDTFAPRRPCTRTGPRRLVERDRPAMLAHLLRLSDDDRRMRFLQMTTDAMLRAYVERVRFDVSPCFGVFSAGGALIALGEALPAGDGRRSYEAAFTTDASWRRLGLARALFEAIATELAGDGGQDRVEIVLHCDARNRPMRALLQRIGAEVALDDGELTAVWRRRPIEASRAH